MPIRNPLFFLIKVLLLFGFIYPFSLRVLGLPEALHASRVASVLIVLLAIIRPHNYSRFRKNYFYCEYKKVFKLILCTCIYCLFLTLIIGYGTGSNYLAICIDNILFALLPIGAFYGLFDDIEEFAEAIIIVTLIQSVAILLGTFIPGVSYIFQVLFDNNAGYADRDLEALSQSYASGIACFTSEGVTRFTIGLVACGYKYISSKKIVYVGLYIFLSVVNSMLSRTGMLMSIVGLLVIMYFLVKSRGISFLGLIPFVVLAFFSYFIISDLSPDFYDRFSRYAEFKDDGVESFFYAYFKENEIPSISLSTIIGTSVLSGRSGNGIVVSADGGWVKNYVALGLFMSIFVYGYLIRMFFRIKRIFKGTCVEYILVFYGLYIIMSDFKEYFLLYRGSISLFFLFVMFAYNKYFTRNESETQSRIIYR